jgi:hypothetical protein
MSLPTTVFLSSLVATFITKFLVMKGFLKLALHVSSILDVMIGL